MAVRDTVFTFLLCAQVVVHNCSFTSNQAGTWGGAVTLVGSGRALIKYGQLAAGCNAAVLSRYISYTKSFASLCCACVVLLRGQYLLLLLLLCWQFYALHSS